MFFRKSQVILETFTVEYIVTLYHCLRIAITADNITTQIKIKNSKRLALKNLQRQFEIFLKMGVLEISHGDLPRLISPFRCFSDPRRAEPLEALESSSSTPDFVGHSEPAVSRPTTVTMESQMKLDDDDDDDDDDEMYEMYDFSGELCGTFSLSIQDASHGDISWYNHSMTRYDKCRAVLQPVETCRNLSRIFSEPAMVMAAATGHKASRLPPVHRSHHHTAGTAGISTRAVPASHWNMKRTPLVN